MTGAAVIFSAPDGAGPRTGLPSHYERVAFFELLPARTRNRGEPSAGAYAATRGRGEWVVRRHGLRRARLLRGQAAGADRYPAATSGIAPVPIHRQPTPGQLQLALRPESVSRTDGARLPRRRHRLRPTRPRQRHAA